MENKTLNKNKKKNFIERVKLARTLTSFGEFPIFTTVRVDFEDRLFLLNPYYINLKEMIYKGTNGNIPNLQLWRMF